MQKKWYKSKTVLTCIATVLYALSGWYLGNLDPQAAMAMVFGASGLYGLRDAL